MKRILVMAFIVLHFIIPLKAQTITNKPQIDVILIPFFRNYDYSNNRYLLESFLTKSLKIKKSRPLEVIGLMNKTENFHFDISISTFNLRYFLFVQQGESMGTA